MAPKPPTNGSTRVPGTGNFNGVSPVLLSANCDVLANNSNTPDLGLLSYPFRKAIVINEIRWTLRCPSTARQNLGSLVTTRMSLGQKYLMRDPVPVWLMGTLMSWAEEEATVDTFITNTQTAFSHYRWILPRPLYLEAGQVLAPTFFRGNDLLGTINVQVSYAGWTVAPSQPVPSIIAVPYVAPFITVSGMTYDQSNENDLANPFAYPIHIQRLTGRVQLFSAGPSRYNMVEALTPAVAGSNITVLMNDSWGGKMVNNNTGPSDVFDCLRAGWTVDTIMPEKGVYETRVWNVPANTVLHVGMIGHRDEAL